MTDASNAKTIAVLADCHIHPPRIAWPEGLAAALGPVDLIITLGDMGEGLADLARIAPLIGVKGEDDAPDERAADATRMIEAGGVRLGLVFDPVTHGFASGKEPFVWSSETREAEGRAFGGAGVDVLLHASTHISAIDTSQGRLAVNPGSLTLPSDGKRSFARLTIENGQARAEIVVI